MIGDMGIQVYDEAPDAETLLMSEAPRRRCPTEDVEEEAEAARVDARFRVRPHHRPGAHVHARDGLGRAAHARRRDRDRQAHRGRPEAHDPGDLRVPDDGRARSSSSPTRSRRTRSSRRGRRRPDRLRNAEEIDRRSKMADERRRRARGRRGRGRGRRRASPAREPASSCKVAALERFDAIRQLYEQDADGAAEGGLARQARTSRLQEKISDELMKIRFSAQAGRAAVRQRAQQVDDIRQLRAQDHGPRREQGAACRARTSSRSSPATRRSLRWIDREIDGASQPYSEQLAQVSSRRSSSSSRSCSTCRRA